MDVVGPEPEATGVGSAVTCFDCFFWAWVGGLGFETDGAVPGSLDLEEVAAEGLD